jgi:hypothetical protein
MQSIVAMNALTLDAKQINDGAIDLNRDKTVTLNHCNRFSCYNAYIG